MKYTILFLFAMITFSFQSCSISKEGHPSIKQGVYGKVLWKQGNMMPSPGTATVDKDQHVKRTVQIYEVAKLSDAEGQSPLFTHIKTKLVGKVKTNAEGYFQCSLAPGTYSIFTVEENGQLFASLSNGKGEIASFEVKAGEVTRYDITVNYKAYY